MRKLFVLAAVLLLSNNSFGQTAGNTDLVLYGVATRSCGQFLQAQARNNEDYGFFVSWLQGYLSAVNLHTVHGRRDIGKATDMDSMLLWLKTHCSINPLDNFSLSVLKLTLELK